MVHHQLIVASQRLDSILFGVAILTDCTLTGTLVAILHSRRTEFAQWALHLLAAVVAC